MLECFRFRASLSCDDDQESKHRTCGGFLLRAQCHHLPWQGSTDSVNVDPYPGVVKTVFIFASFKKGKRGQTGTFDQYNFYARFPMNLIQVTSWKTKLLILFQIILYLNFKKI